MYNKQRTAVDIQGNRVVITEKTQDPGNGIGQNSSVPKSPGSAFFDPDGKRLIPEGKGFFRSPWGIRYQLID
jgi:hypothetical protein